MQTEMRLDLSIMTIEMIEAMTKTWNDNGYDYEIECYDNYYTPLGKHSPNTPTTINLKFI